MNTQEFLSHFSGNICYCALDDKRKVAGLTHYHEGYDLTREQILNELNKANNAGFGIFFCVNEINRDLDPARTRTAKMLVRIRAVWADVDAKSDSPRTDWPIKPSLIVNTSPGKYHYYWLTSTDNVEEWRQVMNGIANAFGADSNARDLVRVLRLPGFKHHKAEPFLSTVVDGDGYVYEWRDIIESFPPDQSTPKSSYSPTGDKRSFSNFDEAKTSIVDGENFHGAIMWLLNHWVNSGLDSPDELKFLIRSILAQSHIQDQRWEERNEEHYLDANIRDAIQFVSANPLFDVVDVKTVDVSETQVDLGWPPGLMGELCREIYEMAPHPNEEIAILAGFTLVSGISGRTFNVLGSGVNLYTACLARTGIGKSTIKDSINLALRKVGVLNNGASFMGPSRITGPKALLRILHEHPTRILVLEESGLLSASRSGDSAGIIRTLLDLYTSSGKDQWFGEETYSKKEESVAAIRAPSVTLVHVSTPESYIRALRAKDSVNSGDLARIWTVRSLRDKSQLNMVRRKDYGNDTSKRINEILGICKVNQSNEMLKSPKVIDLDTSRINIESEDQFWVDVENNTFAVDPIKATIASRAAMKIMKIAAVASIFNDHGNKVSPDEYEWAKRAVLTEFNSINIAISLGSPDDLGATVDSIVIPAITKLLNNQYKAPGCKIAKALLGKGCFSRTNLSSALKNNQTIKALDSDPQKSSVVKTGLDKVIDYLIKNGLMFKLTENQKRYFGHYQGMSGDVYRVTDEFKIRVGMY